MNKTRRQHYVPVSYLSRFTDNDQIYVTDFRENKCYPSSPKDIANIRDFYVLEKNDASIDNTVESYFAEVENKTKSILDNFIKTMHLPKERDWHILTEFIAGLHLRVPEMRKKHLELSHYYFDFMNHYKFSTEDAYKQTCAQYYKDTGKKIDMTYEEAKEMIEKPELYYIALHQNEYIQQIFSLLPQIHNIIFRMTPYLLFSVGNARFITSDNPVIIIDTNSKRPDYLGYGWLTKTVQAYCPISPFCCIALAWEGEYNAYPINDFGVASINSYITFFCTRYIFSNENKIYWCKKDGKICSDYKNYVNEFAPFKENKISTFISGPLPQISRDFNLNMIRKSSYRK